jgi:hypothetical protein
MVDELHLIGKERMKVYIKKNRSLYKTYLPKKNVESICSTCYFRNRGSFEMWICSHASQLTWFFYQTPSHNFVFFRTYVLCYFETTREIFFHSFSMLKCFLFQSKYTCSPRCIILGNDHATISMNKYWCWFVVC